MRKKEKQEILEFINSLREAHEKIMVAMEERKYIEAMNILYDCQECTIELGNLIEVLEGEATISISYIEKYCELVFRCYQKLSLNTKEEIENSRNFSKKLVDGLNKQLFNMEMSIKNDIKEKKEVVFFPYKASMWDSMESVYLRAKKDESCDVYCVPIPYYNKKTDGTLGEMHYEGAEYPNDVDITDWKVYDYKKRRPEIIYIHNPYDHLNIVTCVHPDFFARNLKPYTEKLVYIPYFVLREIEPDDQAAIDKMKNFCYLPGTIYADKVLLQSENMRRIYIKEYKKAAILHGEEISQKQLEEKFLTTGSPKLDKVRKVNSVIKNMPDEWLRIIKKPDGSQKKVILYNTSIAAFLQEKQEMILKIERVLSLFKEEKDSITLLWRPHPLIRATLQTMLPQLWFEYESIVRNYKKEGWGIFDDTADLYRAIAISDGYYGDHSSVVQLYQEIGKPIMIQNVKLR